MTYGYTVLICGGLAARLELELRGVAVDVVLGAKASWPTLWECDPDLVVLAGYTERVPEDILDAYTVIGWHPSLLPAYRGGSAIKWQLHEKAPQLGSTVYRLVPGKMDAGPVVAYAPLGRGVSPSTDTAGSLYALLADAGLRALVRAVRAYADGTYVEAPQDEALASWHPRLARGQSPLEYLDARANRDPSA